MKLSPEQAQSVLRNLRFRGGLITAVVCDSKTKEVLMVAHQNREAVVRTLTEGRMYFWSRERKKLWLKGESSGHFQLLVRLFIDCDGDAILYHVRQLGGACHEGYRSCFHREVRGGKVRIIGRKVFDPSKVYGKLG